MKSGSWIWVFSTGAAVILGCSGSSGSSTSDPPTNSSSSGSSSSSSGTSGAPATSSGGSTNNNNENAASSTQGTGPCSKLTATYDESRTSAAGAQDTCLKATYIAPVNFSDPPALNPTPGCTTLKDEWSADQCTHTVVTKCDSPDNNTSTCTEVLTFGHDDKGYSGTATCNGTSDTVDDDHVPFTCTTAITGTKK